MPMRPTDLLYMQLYANGIAPPAREYKFIPPRRFRFDYAYPLRKIAVEVNGGNWVRGRHVRAKALENEYEKLSLAAVHGWRVLIVSPDAIRAGKAFHWIKEALESEITK